MKKLYGNILISLVIFIVPACSTDKGIRVFVNKNSMVKPSEVLSLSKDRIENETTHEIYFTLEKNTDCIKIDIISSAVANEFTGKRESLKTFFIVEQIIDVSRFGDEKTRYVFSEIGRNFDQGWERKKDITICTDKNDPLAVLSGKAYYRLRFSNFQKMRSDFELHIQADCKVFYHEKIPETGDVEKNPEMPKK